MAEEMMQALVRREYGDWRKLTLESVPRPSLKKNQLLVKVEYAAIDASMDHLLQGDPTLVRLMLGLSKPKHIGVGQSFSGTIVEVGHTHGFSVGEKVFGIGQGTFAEFAITKSDWIARIPNGLSMEKAATIPVSAVTANDAIKMLPAGASRALVIGGSGAVGSFLIQFLRRQGVDVTASASENKKHWVKDLGANNVIGHDEIPQLEPSFFDVVFVLGGANPLKSLTPLTKSRGLVVLIGSDRMGSRFFGGYLASTLESMLSRGKQKMIFSQDKPELLLEAAEEILELPSVGVINVGLDSAIEQVAGYQSGGSFGRPLIQINSLSN